VQFKILELGSLRAKGVGGDSPGSLDTRRDREKVGPERVSWKSSYQEGGPGTVSGGSSQELGCTQVPQGLLLGGQKIKQRKRKPGTKQSVISRLWAGVGRTLGKLSGRHGGGNPRTAGPPTDRVW